MLQAEKSHTLQIRGVAFSRRIRGVAQRPSLQRSSRPPSRSPHASVSITRTLHENNQLDTSVIHGDGTTTPAKKGGDNIGFSGHKKVKGDKVVAFCDRNCNVIAPFVSAPGNRNESPLLREALPQVTRIAQVVGFALQGTVVSLDGVYDCRMNRKAIFNRAMVPTSTRIPVAENSPSEAASRFSTQLFSKSGFHTIERVFGWEDKFRRLLLRFERLSQLHYAFKTLAYTMINRRHFCQG
jgi:hypothetical protein